MQVPEGISDEEGVLLGDILSTAYFCAENGGIREGDTVAVVGLGPVGASQGYLNGVHGVLLLPWCVFTGTG